MNSSEFTTNPQLKISQIKMPLFFLVTGLLLNSENFKYEKEKYMLTTCINSL